MVTVATDKQTAEIAEGSHVWFRQGEAEAFIEWADLQDTNSIVNIRNQIDRLTGELVDFLPSIRLRKM
jgi:hypothetical protein